MCLAVYDNLCRLTMPLAEVLYDFFDRLKSSLSQGYASLRLRTRRLPRIRPGQARHPDQRRSRRRPGRHRAPGQGLPIRAGVLATNQAVIPRQLFEVIIQAAIGTTIIAETVVNAPWQERNGQVLRWRHHAASASCWKNRKKAKSG